MNPIKVGKIYKLKIADETDTPVVVHDVKKDSIELWRLGYKDSVVIYYQLDDPEYLIIDPCELFCEWYEEYV